MNFGNVFDDPRFWCMTTAAIKPNRLVVHIGMARHAIGVGLIKNKGWVAQFAVYLLVQPFKGEFRYVVIEGIGPGLQGPAFGGVAVLTGDGQGFPMGRLAIQTAGQQHQQNYL